MGIFCDVRPHIQRLTVFKKNTVYYCKCCNGLFGAILLKSFYFPHFLHLDWDDLPYTVSTVPQQRRNSLGLTALDVLHHFNDGKISAEHIFTSEIYRGIPLLSTFTVYSIYNGLYIVLFRVAPRRSTCVRGRHGSSAAASRVLPGEEPARVGELRRTSALCVDVPYERIRPASKLIYFLYVRLCQIFAHRFNP